jgi:hypothetical protein
MPDQGFGVWIDADRQLEPDTPGRAKPAALRRPNWAKLGKTLHGFFLPANLGLAKLAVLQMSARFLFGRPGAPQIPVWKT